MSNLAVLCHPGHIKYKDAVILAQDIDSELINSKINYDSKLDKYDYLLAYNNLNYLSLVNLRDKNYFYNNQIKKYIYVDYLNNIIAGKKIYSFNNTDSIVKAVSLKNIQQLDYYKNKNINFLDGTAGFTFDSYGLWLLFNQGNKINNNIDFSLIENSKIIYCLVKDGLERAGLAGKIQLYNYNLLQYLNNNKKNYDIIYLDPMFSDGSKLKSKPQENMQLLQNICHNPEDVLLLLKKALEYSNYKVILKRSRQHPKLLEKYINYSTQSKQIRYDVYLV